MDDKSFVSLEQQICRVCGGRFDTGAILLDKRLRASMAHHTTTGWGLCPKDQQLFDEGFVALVECDPQRSGLQPDSTTLRQEHAHRTGRMAHLKREVFARLFDVPITADQACVFVEPGIIERLQAMTPSSD